MRQSAFILLVEDENELRSALKDVLSHAQYHVEAVANIGQANEAIDRNKFDLSILDVRLPDGNGIDLLRKVRHTDSDNAVIMMTAYADVDLAVDAIRLGADDFIKKPFDMDELLVRIEELLKKRNLLRDNKALTKEVQALRSQNSLIGQSESINKVRQMIEVLSDSESTVLITGESGSGKEVIARQLHTVGTRANKPFVSINCGAIPEELLESELFGHVKGAFTGAVRARPGRFELANGGVIFLDEIGDMSPKLQVKLLRVLQERCFEPVGSEKHLKLTFALSLPHIETLKKKSQLAVSERICTTALMLYRFTSPPCGNAVRMYYYWPSILCSTSTQPNSLNSTELRKKQRRLCLITTGREMCASYKMLWSVLPP